MTMFSIRAWLCTKSSHANWLLDYITLHITDNTFVKVGCERVDLSLLKKMEGEREREMVETLSQMECDSGNGAVITINKQLYSYWNSTGLADLL